MIDPDICVDCDMCPAECPADAIFEEDEVPDDQLHFIALNAELAKLWPTIDASKEPLPNWQEWDGVADKLAHLERS